MAKSLNAYQDKSSFERNINSISSLLIKFMVVMVPVIFIAIFLTQGSWLDSLMFGITIAVGLMPEMLPVIMTSSLAKGAVNMSKKQTIVKRLGSIQTFGEMDILCTDKKSGLYTLSSFTVCIAFNAVLKLTACVYRPWIRDSRVLPAGDAITTATGYSFPSGHTSTAVPIYGSLAVSVRKAQKWISVLCIVCLVLTAFSRNYLGVHTPQDVLTATALGISAIFGMSKLFRYLSAHPEKENYFLLAGVILGICGILFISLKTYPMDYVDGKLLVDPDRMMKDDYGDVGALIAFCIARFIEKTWIQFKPVLSKKALVCGLAGAVIMFFMRESLGTPLKSLLGLHWGCFAENLIIISFIVAVWPLVMKHATKTEEPAVPVPAEAS